MLVVRNLKKRFGAIEALRDVSFSLAAGEVRAICGENGAGKSTLIRTLMGMFKADAGSIEVDGRVQAISSARQAQQLGFALVAQELSLVPHLSVLDNIWLGDGTVPFFHRRRELRERATAALSLLDADFDLARPVGTLSLGERQIVEIARLLAREARVLILDEPTATLSDIEIERMMTALRRLKEQGRSIIYVTHRLGEVFQICDSVTVLRNGADVAAHQVTEIDRRRLIESMLGRSFGEMYPARNVRRAAHDGLEIEKLSVPGLVHDFSMRAPRGEITCIAGQVGAGATRVVRAVAGLIPDARGRLTLDGKPVELGSVASRLAHNMSFVSNDRASEGLFRRSVLENVVASRLAEHARAGFVSWPALRRLATSVCQQVQVDTARLNGSAFDLSGGNQQKLLFARALDASAPGVLLVIEPTRGVDVGARAEIYKLLRQFCDLGFALLVSSTDLEEVVGIANSVVSMYRGRQVGRYGRDEIDMARILADITHPVAMEQVA